VHLDDVVVKVRAAPLALTVHARIANINIIMQARFPEVTSIRAQIIGLLVSTCFSQFEFTYFQYATYAYKEEEQHPARHPETQSISDSR
jgi:hypothetical protein